MAQDLHPPADRLEPSSPSWEYGDVSVSFSHNGGSMHVRVQVPDAANKSLNQIKAEAIDLARPAFRDLIRAFRGKDD
jgi:hypothetical protein